MIQYQSHNLLSSLAFIKVYGDTNNNGYLNLFLPFLSECLRESSNDVISILEVQDSFKRIFGLVIPQHVIKSILKKAQKKDFVFVKDHIFYKNCDKLNSLSFKTTQNKVQRIYSSLILNFIEYSKKKFNEDYTEEIAERIILSFISYNNIKMISHDPIDSIIPELPELSTKEKIVISGYINYIIQSDPQLYEYLDIVIKGYMLSDPS